MNVKSKIMKNKETLKQAAEMHFEWTKNDESLTCKDHFINGAKWQQKQDKKMYSEQEAFNMLMDFWKEERPGFKTNPVCVSNWFEQFKNK